MILITICSILTIISICMIVCGKCNQLSATAIMVQDLGWILLVVTTLIGWVIFGLLATDTTTYTEVDFDLFKTKDVAIVTSVIDGEKPFVHVITDIRDYILVDKLDKIYIQTPLNSYGYNSAQSPNLSLSGENGFYKLKVTEINTLNLYKE